MFTVPHLPIMNLTPIVICQTDLVSFLIVKSGFCSLELTLNFCSQYRVAHAQCMHGSWQIAHDLLLLQLCPHNLHPLSVLPSCPKLMLGFGIVGSYSGQRFGIVRTQVILAYSFFSCSGFFCIGLSMSQWSRVIWQLLVQANCIQI